MDATLDEVYPVGTDTRTSLDRMGITGLEQIGPQLIAKEALIRDSTRVPSKDAPAEDWKTFHQKMGAGAKVEDYGLPESASEGMNGILGSLRESAMESGVTVKQWQSLTQKASELNAGQLEDVGQQLKDHAQAFETEFRAKCTAEGKNADDLIAQAQRGLDAYCTDDPRFKAVLDLTGLGSSGVMLEHFMKVNEVISPDIGATGIPDGGLGDSFDDHLKLANETKALAQEEGFNSKNHPKHNELMIKFRTNIKKLQDAGYDGCMDKKFTADDVFAEENADILADLKKAQGFTAH